MAFRTAWGRVETVLPAAFTSPSISLYPLVIFIFCDWIYWREFLDCTAEIAENAEKRFLGYAARRGLRTRRREVTVILEMTVTCPPIPAKRTPRADQAALRAPTCQARRGVLCAGGAWCVQERTHPTWLALPAPTPQARSEINHCQRPIL